MAILKIVKGKEFKLTINDMIDKNDVFYEEYRRAAAMLDEIIAASNSEYEQEGSESIWKNSEFENNVIAFCGERGEGKSSAMMTFVNSVCHYEKNKDFFDNNFIKDVYFTEPMMIDPSLFDDVHNVLDIVLAKLYQNFNQKYDEDSSRIDIGRRERLLDQFQKVYRHISLINNQTKILDDEFDYEGNIGKLSKLGESTRLKEELKELIAEYLVFLQKFEKKEHKTRSGVLIIAIDDLDLCSENAYKMAEQIRKYLIIPNVAIVMAVRIEQLELCVEEKNLKDFQYSANQNYNLENGQHFHNEVRDMAERYVSKLIPMARRLYLPKVQSFNDVQVLYVIESENEKENNVIWDSKQSTDIVKAALQLIHEKTGMYFLPEKNLNSFLLPDNLRGMVNWIVLLADLKDVETDRDAIRFNTGLFKTYFEKEWMAKLSEEQMDKIGQIGNMDAYHIHINTRLALMKEQKQIEDQLGISQSLSLEKPNVKLNCFFEALQLFEWLRENSFDMKKECFISGLRTFYTIEMNQLLQQEQYDALSEFIGGYIWGPYFQNVIPAVQETQIDRSRFIIKTEKVFLEIGKFINVDLRDSAQSSNKVSKILENQNKTERIKVWLLLGMLSNVFYTDGMNNILYISKGNIIFDNFDLLEYIHISVENYLVSLCNLDKLYDKINFSILGIEEEDIKPIISELKQNNDEVINYARIIISNVDLVIDLKRICLENRDYKRKTKSETDRSVKLIDQFWENIVSCLKLHGIAKNISKDIFKYFIIGKKGTEQEKVNISQLYAELLDLAGKQFQEVDVNMLSINSAVEEFKQKLILIPEEWKNKASTVSAYLITTTAKNAKAQLENLAFNVQRYIGINKKMPPSLSASNLCDFYRKIVELFYQDENTELPNDLKEQYKKFAALNKELI